MLFGLGIGLAIAAAVYFSDHRAPVPAASSTSAAPLVPLRTEPASPPPQTTAAEDDSASEPHPASRFEFYDMLPQVEVVIPDAPRSNDRTAPTTQVDTAGNYVLQAGAFTGAEDADRRQASLALLGIESRIQSVPIDDETWHRVRIGPIDDLSELNRIRRRLWEADIDTLVIRVPNSR
jgi:cell division protein FtsN